LFDAPTHVTEQYKWRLAHRENVFLELGLVLGSLGPDRVLIAVIDDSSDSFCFPSELAGLRTTRFYPSISPYKSFAPTAGNIAHEVRRAVARLEPRPEQALSSFSCFISYVHQDKALVERLYNDLSELGVRCWLDTKQIHIGELLRERIEAGLRTSDKVIAVLSRHAVASRWFRQEVDSALEFEGGRGDTFVFPIRTDDAILETEDKFWQVMKDRHIANFNEWSNTQSYRRSFAKLAKDLTLSVATGGVRQ
jgi:hypothetical protein